MAIRSLRTRIRPDNLKNQVRPNQSLARRLYLGSLLAGAAWIAMLFAGQYVFMDADGLVVQDRQVVTPGFAAQVATVNVKPGDYVRAGQLVGTVVSTQMLDVTSDLTARQAQARSRASQIRARLEAIEATLPAARQRQADTTVAMQLVDRARQRGYATATRQSQFSQERYAAVRETASLLAEHKALVSEQSAVNGDLKRLDATLRKAVSAYRDGQVYSPVSGTVGSTVVAAGSYMSPGDNFAEIYHGPKYVMAYLPTNRLYAIKHGEAVVITDGVNSQTGAIERVEVIADKLPPEFQSSFRGVDRHQVVRVAMRPPGTFPVFAKIKVTGTNTPSKLLDDAGTYIQTAWAETVAGR